MFYTLATGQPGNAMELAITVGGSEGIARPSSGLPTTAAPCGGYVRILALQGLLHELREGQALGFSCLQDHCSSSFRGDKVWNVEEA